ncbi:hypothetical protein [Streptacidiphilus jiangxiensis]|uniref:hypothetical protein n=1 Tax=Streptacidiphilus jiangxiensis TaxID=235985 RepID=UPI0005A6AD22|nr:hypothetical protein [Streptacidiphilus jiangxiensis]
MIWMIEAAEKGQPWITEEYRLPESFDIDTAAAWVGDHPDLVGSVFDVPPSRIPEMEQLLGITADADRVEYFLVARAD